MQRLQRTVYIAFATSLLAVIDSTGHAQRSHPRDSRSAAVPTISAPDASRDLPRGLRPTPRRSAAVSDTTWLGHWDFDGSAGDCDPQGWSTVDLNNTEPGGVFWHVDDFAGLNGGDFGRLVPLQGAQSMWLGLRDSPELACEYATLPGYGDNWFQEFLTVDCLSVTGDVTISFLQTYDTELAYDFVYVQYDTCGGDWNTLGIYDGIGSGFYSHTVPASQHNGSLRFRFYFTSDWAWSDSDGDPNPRSLAHKIPVAACFRYQSTSLLLRPSSFRPCMLT